MLTIFSRPYIPKISNNVDGFGNTQEPQIEYPNLLLKKFSTTVILLLNKTIMTRQIVISNMNIKLTTTRQIIILNTTKNMTTTRQIIFIQKTTNNYNKT